MFIKEHFQNSFLRGGWVGIGFATEFVSQAFVAPFLAIQMSFVLEADVAD